MRWNGIREAYGAISTASSSIATIRSRWRTSAWTRSASRLPPIVRTAEAPKRSRPRAAGGGDKVHGVQRPCVGGRRRARLVALIDDQVPARRVGVRAHPLPPHL